MIKRYLYFVPFLFVTTAVVAQEAPNVANSTELSPNTAAGAQAANATVNYFTGIPNVTIPLYSYSGKGMHLNIDAEYIGGGARDGQEGSIIGMGWYLNAGGLITRTVRGVPDDLPSYGFMNAAAIPTDFRSNGDKYYYDSIDAQPDIFQFSLNGRSGEFYIGKNHQIVVVPQSMLKVQYVMDDFGITSFKITTEDGVKYIFATPEYTSQWVTQGNSYYKSAYSGSFHNSAWYLTQIISPFYTDTIKFTYSTKHLNTTFSYPAISIVNQSNHAQVAFYNSTGTNSSAIIKLSSISFPDKTVASFVYSNVYRYDDTDFALAKLNISDSVLRKGFIFDYQTSYTGNITKYDAAHDQDIVTSASYTTNLLLKSITPYTAKEATKGYSFLYNTPYPNFHTYALKDSVLNAYDYWGYFNGWNSRTDPLPYISGVDLSGANRNQSSSRITENSLSYVYYPTGGVTHYEYEPNTIKPAIPQPESISLAATTSSNISLSQISSTVHELNFSEENVDRSGSPPFSGTCNLVFNVKSTDGATLYATTTISLYDLFYLGLKKWDFSVPNNGTYKLESSLSGGGTIPWNYFTQITWMNKAESDINLTAGGIRVSKIMNQSMSDDTITNTIIEELHYNTPDGESSGFLDDIPQYYYPYQKIITSSSSTTNLYVISSDPVDNMNYAQGNSIGYSHVEVFKGTSTKNIGKTVYDFTSLLDVGANYFYATFPYGPQNIKEWGIGLPKRITVYDSSGNLIQSTTNQYSFPSTTFNTTDFEGLKLGCSATTYVDDPNLYPTTARTNTYIGQQYYISTGHASLDETLDTVFHDDGSIQTKSISYTYDSYYNLIKATTAYDRTKGLNLETRIYYPYDYTFSTGSIKTLKDSNIITPVISTEKWITGDANPRMVDATVTNYQTLTTNQIVPVAIYKLQSNSPVSQSVIGTFNPSSLIRNWTYMVQQNAYSLFDAAGNDVQFTNQITGQKSSALYDYNNQLIIAKASNASHTDIAYTSFESDGNGDWTIGSPLRDQTSSITGKLSYNLSNGNLSKSNLTASVTYIVTLWAKSGASVTINGASVGTPISTHRNWNLYSVSLTGVTSVTASGSGLIDEIRLFPKDANMITYTYEPNVGVISICDANNTILYSEYDGLNRIKLARDIDNNILKRYDYSDSETNMNIAANWVATSKACDPPGSGNYDSVYTDENPNSATYNNTISIYKGTDYCSCAVNPQYKIVNGTCEEGIKVVTESSHVKVNGIWQWKCAYHYKWSDNYISSPDTVEFHPDSPTSPCFVIDP